MHRSTLIFGLCLLIVGLINLRDPLTAATNIAFGLSLLIYPAQESDWFISGRKFTAYSMSILATLLMIIVITTDFLT